MRRLSTWFAAHVAFARIIIAIAHLLFTALALQWAGLLQTLPSYIPLSWFIVAALGCVLLAIAAHFIKRKFAFRVSTRTGYALVRLKYGMVLIAAYLLVAGWFYHDGLLYYSGTPALLGSFSPMTSVQNQATQPASNSGFAAGKQKLRLSFRALKQELRAAKKIRKSSADPNSDATLAIVGILILALALAFLVLTAACNLSCAGSGTGAVLVGVGGLALITWGAVIWIRHVNRKTREKLEGGGNPPASKAAILPESNMNAIQ